MPTKTKTLSAKEKSFVEFVKGIIGRHRDHDKIAEILKKNGFKIVNSGGFKTVFRRKFDSYCVKVWHHSFGWESDSYKVPEPLRDHFVHPIYLNKRYLIQKWVSGKFSGYGYKKTVKRLPEELMNSCYDVRDDNIRVDGNREVVIDFCNKYW